MVLLGPNWENKLIWHWSLYFISRFCLNLLYKQCCRFRYFKCLLNNSLLLPKYCKNSVHDNEGTNSSNFEVYVIILYILSRYSNTGTNIHLFSCIYSIKSNTFWVAWIIAVHINTRILCRYRMTSRQHVTFSL